MQRYEAKPKYNKWALGLLIGFFITLIHVGMILLGIHRNAYNMLLSGLVAAVFAQILFLYWPMRH